MITFSLFITLTPIFPFMQGLNRLKGWQNEDSYKLLFQQENTEGLSTSYKAKQSILTIFLGISVPLSAEGITSAKRAEI